MRPASKHRAIRTEVDGVKFDSRAEARRWRELQLLERAGQIVDLKRQVPFPLIVNGVQVAKFIADFTYRTSFGDPEHVIIEDVKSEHTRKLPVYRLKAKMFAAQYGRKITEVIR